MKRPMLVAAVLAAIVLSIAATGCGNDSEPAADRVTVQLKWKHSAQFAGMYVAEQKGFYAEENIEVTLEPGGIDVDEVGAVASGDADFGLVEGEGVLKARSEDVPVVAIAVVYARSPTVYFALKDSGIEKLEDFVGKRVVVNPIDRHLPMMLARIGVDLDQLVAVPPSYDMDAFFSGDVDVWSGYLTNEVIIAQEKGYELNIFHPDDYGVHKYNDIIITTEDAIERRPDLVERFLRATLKGWRYAIANRDEAVDLTLQYDDALDRDRESRKMEAQVYLTHTGQVELGWMESGIWQEMYQAFLGSGAIVLPVDVNEAYTMRFLNEVYGREE